MQVIPKNNIEPSNNVDFNQLWLRHVVYWPFFLLLFLLSFTAAWLYLFFSVPTYEAFAKVLIKDERKGAENSDAMDYLNLVGTKKILENEKEVISSKSLIIDVVKHLALYAPVFQKGKIRAVSAYKISPVLIEVKDPESLEETEDIYFSFDKANSRVIIGGSSYPLNKWVSINIADSVRFLPNKAYHSENKKFFFKLVNPNYIADEIKGNLEVTTSSKMSSILDLELKDEMPERAKDILNELMVVYNDASKHEKNSLAENTLAFVQERLNHISQDLDSVENKMQKYKSRKGAVNISTQGELFLKNVSDNDQKLIEVNMQLAVLNQVEQYALANSNGAGIVPSTLGVNDPTLSNMLGLLYQAELEYTKLKNTEAENSPSMISIKNQIEKIKPNIIENIQSQRRTLETSKANIVSTNSGYSSALQTIPEKEKELLDINREHNIISNIYAFLLQKREESALTLASNLPNSSIVDKADTTYLPIKPKPKMIYTLAFLVPFIIGVGLITVRETFNSKVLFSHEIEGITSYPIIGEISYNKSKSPIVINRNSRTFIAEQFRQLRVALSLKNDVVNGKRILVTSTIAGEGKSFVALNLALTFALSGKKTVLLELDLSNPSITDKVNVASNPGISDYLQGFSEPEEIIRRADINENLFIVPAGPASDGHPSELLENGRIMELLNYLNEAFDWVIIDTAPVSSITDAYILSSGCDTTLYVVRHRYTPKVFIQRLDQNNKNNQLNNVSIVFNGIRPRGFGKHHYGYGYGYGYVYNEKNKTKSKTKI